MDDLQQKFAERSRIIRHVKAFGVDKSAKGSLKGDCTLCGHKKDAPIHSSPYDPSTTFRAIPFHLYCPPTN